MDGWRKSSYSAANGNCPEVAAWTTSSHSTHNGNCVEAGSCRHGVAVRDSQLAGSSPVLTFSSEEWERWIGRIKADA